LIPSLEMEKATRSGVGPTDAALVVAARAGEMWAKEALFRRHARTVNGLVFRLLGRDNADFEDHVQEAFCLSFESLHTLREPQAYASFLCSTAVRVVYKTLKRKKMLARLGLARPRPLDDRPELASRAAPPDAAAELKAVFACLVELDAKEQLVVVLRRVEGYKIDEIVALTGMSSGTVKRKLARAEERLERRFGGGLS
jgi:RNA polymerase sigma-70 factor, ECF subfamily